MQDLSRMSAFLAPNPVLSSRSALNDVSRTNFLSQRRAWTVPSCGSSQRSHIYMQEVTRESITPALDTEVPTAEDIPEVKQDVPSNSGFTDSAPSTEHSEQESEAKASAGAVALGEGDAVTDENKGNQAESDEVVVEEPRVEEAKEDTETEAADDPSEERSPERRGRKRWASRRKVTHPMADLEAGKQYPGTVKKVMNYGAFVDIGAEKDGLLHVSRMSNAFVKDVSEICKAGDTIEVFVIQKDAEKGTFSLATAANMESRSDRSQRDAGAKETRAAKWASFKYDEKEFVEGTVKHIADFGIFVDVNGPADGLVHLSEIPRSQPKDSFTQGMNVKVRVISDDQKRNRIGLSMKEWKPDAATISKQVKAATADQPVFKTSFEIAWERAMALKEENEKAAQEAETR